MNTDEDEKNSDNEDEYEKKDESNRGATRTRDNLLSVSAFEEGRRVGPERVTAPRVHIIA